MKNDIEKDRHVTLSDDIYTKKTVRVLLLLGAIGLLSGLFLNFPVAETTSMFSSKAMDSVLMCLNSYDKKEQSWPVPKVVFFKPDINGSCYGQPNHSISFDKISLGLSMPGLIPPGLRFHLFLKKQNTHISAFPLISPFGISIQTKDTRIDSGFINDLLDGPLIQGIFSLEARMNSSWSKLKDGHIHIISKNLAIPSQNINGFQLPDISIGNFVLQGMLEKNTLDIKTLSLGSSSSTLQAEISGDIKINKFNVMVSKLDITGRVRFSESFLNSFPLVKFMLKKKDADGFYKFNIKGTTSSPQPVFL